LLFFSFYLVEITFCEAEDVCDMIRLLLQFLDKINGDFSEKRDLLLEFWLFAMVAVCGVYKCQSTARIEVMGLSKLLSSQPLSCMSEKKLGSIKDQH
jgi:hypothetical protein